MDSRAGYEGLAVAANEFDGAVEECLEKVCDPLDVDLVDIVTIRTCQSRSEELEPALKMRADAEHSWLQVDHTTP